VFLSSARLVKQIAGVLAGFFIFAASAGGQSPSAPARISTADLDREIRGFLDREVSAHVADIRTLTPPPDRVVGALTTGEFSWGTFMRVLAAYSRFAGTRTVGGHDVVKMIESMAQIELSRGGKTWAQLYAALALRSFGENLNHNALWQELSPQERESYRVLLDPGRFYDAKSHRLINLPQNYFGVAARIAAISYQLGLNTDRAALNDLLDQAARQFTDGALFADDALPTGRYDRYSNEYARAVYEAAAISGRTDIMKAVSPSLRAQMHLWWDVLSPDAYGYSWGRSLGAISYMDTLEIAAFAGEYPEFRPASLAQLASAYCRAWRWLRNDFNDKTHLLSVFAFGRGDYSYITKEREWQQTTTFFGKAIDAHQEFIKMLQNEGLTSFLNDPGLADVDRYLSFRSGSGRQFGVWVVRSSALHFVLPFVTGPRAATSDYEPAPHGFSGFAVPVEKTYPCLTPFLQLEDGTSIAAADGADEIRFDEQTKSVTALWSHWVVTGGKPGTTVDPGLATKVTWSFDGTSLKRSEVITASKPLRVLRIWMALPSTANRVETSFLGGRRSDLLLSNIASLKVQVTHSDWPLRILALATGDDPLGRGSQGGIPLHLVFESDDISFTAGSSKSWEIVLSVAQAGNSEAGGRP